MSHLAIFDVDDAKGLTAVEHFSSLSEGATPVVVFKNVDVTDEAAVNAATHDISSTFGGIDILLCFAGITGSELAVDYDISRWRKIVDVNLHGSFLVARAVAR